MAKIPTPIPNIVGTDTPLSGIGGAEAFAVGLTLGVALTVGVALAEDVGDGDNVGVATGVELGGVRFATCAAGLLVGAVGATA